MSRLPGVRPPRWAGWAALGLLAALLLGLLQACSPESAQPAAASAPAASAAAAPGPQLLLALSQADGVDWQRVDGASGQVHSLGRSPAAVELWALDDASGDFYFAAEQAVFRGNWRGAGRAPQRLGPLPPAPGRLVAAWLDAGSGTLRAIEMREPTRAEARRMTAEPPDAQPYWAVLWAHSAQGWAETDKRATSWGSDGSLGPAVLDDKRQLRGRSARALDDAAGCAAQLCDHEAPAPAGVAPAAADEWRSLELPGTRLVFGVALGDSWHPVGPLLALSDAAPPRLLLQGSAEALRLQPHQGRLLVSPQQPQTAASGAVPARVIDLASGKSLLLGPAATLPVWVD